MDILLNPNIAYLFLLVGALLGMMALVTPGTGMFELGALFLLALAGYAVYNLDFNWWALVILAAAVVPFVFAIQKQKRELYLGIAIVLLVVGSVFLFAREDGRPAVNPVVAFLASALSAGFLWILVRKGIQAALERPSHDLMALVGKFGEAKTKVQDDGSVQVAGELWSARSDKPITAGSPIKVVGREGFILVVEKDSSKS